MSEQDKKLEEVEDKKIEAPPPSGDGEGIPRSDETATETKGEAGGTPHKDGEGVTEESASEDKEGKKSSTEEVEMVEIPKSEYEELLSAKQVADEEVKRARADALNFRKRVEKEKQSFLEFASGNILAQLLPLSDDLRRLIENGKGEIPETHYNAIISLEQRLNSIYETEGVTLIKIKKGKTAFDPRLHQAVIAIPSDEVEPNIIIDVTASGFVKGDRVLRPAKVVISKGTEPAPEKASEPEKTEKEDKETKENTQENTTQVKEE